MLTKMKAVRDSAASGWRTQRDIKKEKKAAPLMARTESPGLPESGRTSRSGSLSGRASLPLRSGLAVPQEQGVADPGGAHDSAATVDPAAASPVAANPFAALAESPEWGPFIDEIFKNTPAGQSHATLAKLMGEIDALASDSSAVKKRHALGAGMKVKSPTSDMIQSSKKLLPAERLLASAMLEEAILHNRPLQRSLPDGSQRAMTRPEMLDIWISLRIASMRTHTAQDKKKLRKETARDVFVNSYFGLLTAVSAGLFSPFLKAAVDMGLETRRNHERSPGRLEYAGAFNAMMEMLAQPIGDEAQGSIAQALLDEARLTNTLTVREKTAIQQAAYGDALKPKKPKKVELGHSPWKTPAPASIDPAAAREGVIKLAVGDARTPAYRIRAGADAGAAA